MATSDSRRWPRSPTGTQGLALDMIVVQLAQREDRAERRRAHLSRIREANAETLERLADL